jgi:homoserine dehydrogenase
VPEPGECAQSDRVEAHRSGKWFRYSVTLRSLPSDDFLAGARDAENRLEIETQSGELMRVTELGAGRIPTSTAVFAGVLEHARVLDCGRRRKRGRAAAKG